MLKQTVYDKAKTIRLVIFDVDGILTNGQLFYTDEGYAIKSFYVHDGLAIKSLRAHHIEVGIITAHQSPVIDHRMQDLGIIHVYQGYQNKLPAYHDLLNKLGLTPEHVCYVGDDLPDLPLMLRSKLAITVPNAVREVKHRACWQTDARGGEGAVREIAEMILSAQQKWQAVVDDYLTTSES